MPNLEFRSIRGKASKSRRLPDQSRRDLWTILVANGPAIVNVPPLLDMRQQRQISQAREIAIGSDFLAICR
jgi:hypothetical protein